MTSRPKLPVPYGSGGVRRQRQVVGLGHNGIPRAALFVPAGVPRRAESSHANAVASARNATPERRVAASIRAGRTATDTAVPSRVKKPSARDASSSGRNVMVSAIAQV
jgi:hypothetical protein